MAFDRFRQLACTLAAGAGALVAGLALAADAAQVDDKSLAEVAAALSRTLPIMVDAETRLDRVVAGPGKQLVYHYTLIGRQGREVDVERFNAGMLPMLRKSVCSTAGMETLVKGGVALVYNYRGNDEKFVSTIEIQPRHCR